MRPLHIAVVLALAAGLPGSAGATSLSDMVGFAPGLERPNILTIQRILAERGYDTPVSGRMSWATVRAIREYQQDAGLTVTGRADQELINNLNFGPEVYNSRRQSAQLHAVADQPPPAGEPGPPEAMPPGPPPPGRGGLPPLLRPGERSLTAPPAPLDGPPGRSAVPRPGATQAPSALPPEAPPPDTAPPGDVRANPMVADVQRRLQEKGYDPGPPDGVLGPRTQTAIDRFRSNTGLPPGGVDAALIDALGE